MSEGPLAGLLVADFSTALAGPYCTQTLGDLGAEVVKVERPGGGDDTRAWGPPFADGRSTYFQSTNRNKRSVTLDLSDERGRARARGLATAADVVVVNLRPTTARRAGLTHEQVRDRNPSVVHCSISAFGSADTRQLPGYDFLLQAMGGLMSITGQPDGDPTRVGVALVDVITGMNASIAVLAALRHRERTGEGQAVEVDLLSSILAATVNQASGYLNAGVVPGRLGNRHPSVAPYEVFATSDGLIAVAAANDAQFARLCEVLGLPELVEDPRFATNPDRIAHVEALVAVLGEALAARSQHECLEALREVGVPCGPVNDLAEAVELARQVGLDPVVEQTRDDGTVSRQIASPIRLGTTPVAYRRPPPDLDEHGQQVRAWLREIGATSDDEV